jgi:hypothetical protein
MTSHGTCKAKAVLGTATTEGAAYASHSEVTASSLKTWGVLVETYDTGDKVAYSYQLSIPIKGGVPQPGKGTYHATFRIGKLKGIKASGTCNYTVDAAETVNYECVGMYSLADATAAKQSATSR